MGWARPSCITGEAGRRPPLRPAAEPTSLRGRASPGRTARAGQIFLLMIPVRENPADTGRTVRRIIMLGILGIVQDLIDILRIGAFQENDLRPPSLEIGTDLHELIHVLSLTGSIRTPAEKLFPEKALVTVILTSDRPAFQTVRFSPLSLDLTALYGMKTSMSLNLQLKRTIDCFFY